MTTLRDVDSRADLNDHLSYIDEDTLRYLVIVGLPRSIAYERNRLANVAKLARDGFRAGPDSWQTTIETSERMLATLERKLARCQAALETIEAANLAKSQPAPF